VEETSGTAQEKTGGKKVIAFEHAIIAAGSQAVRLPFMPNDPRVIDSTGALALKEVPKRMLILGGGHEAHVAAEVIAGELQGNKELAAAAFNARVIPSVAYTDPEVACPGAFLGFKCV
jgi:pyruvate/2-oxoglutarate dehydrogenase complex dihydrolipoamide dehydrogenase (E3) component